MQHKGSPGEGSQLPYLQGLRARDEVWEVKVLNIIASYHIRIHGKDEVGPGLWEGAQSVNQVVYCLRYPHFHNVQDNLGICKNITELRKIFGQKRTGPNPKDTV